MIGFDRRLDLAWLDATVGLCQRGSDSTQISEQLRQHLEAEVEGMEARRKTVTVLSRIWVNVPERDRPLRKEGLQLAASVAADERLWLHWGMSLLAYPFFRDVAATVGRLDRLQGAFSNAQVQRRMKEKWGQRTTLQRASRRVVGTLVGWGVLRRTSVPGSYVAAPRQQTDDRVLALWLLDCAMRASDAEQIPLRELVQLPCLFPFDLVDLTNDVRLSARFEVSRQGLDLEMVSSTL